MTKYNTDKRRVNKVPSGSYPPGKVIPYQSPRDGTQSMLVVEVRYSEAMGHEYSLLINGEIFEWLTHSVLENFIDSSAKT